ncbi:sulfurtransferase complex subunit TusD [Psychromonas sp. MME2]|uniref:sulfurtransferase complex subunit TusD n=1 Tax=Psychromonas sp. MME2 TaxID=3231033 RepID=UPI00339CA0F3
MEKHKIKFAIVVSAAPYGAQGSSSAYQFASAAILAGHEIVGVFFYQEGVLNANQLVSPATDEINLPDFWAELARKNNFPLEVCVSASLRRGVLDQQEAKQLAQVQFNLKTPFVLSGLGQLAELSASCDRLLQFK